MVDKDNGEFLAVHEEVVKKVLETLPDEEELYDLAELFKVLEIQQELEFFMHCLKVNFA